jgi:two-component system, sensor histidine kinase and response regulator
MDRILHMSGRRRIFQYYIINTVTVATLLICIYVILPENIQKSLSIGLYIISAVSGLTIGTLIAKLISLKQKLTDEKEEFEKKNENIHTYIGNVVHDLRSPVASINMISELLESDLKNISPTYKELIISIRKSSSAMLDRICCILDNTRLEKGINIEQIDAGNPYEIIVSALKKHHIFAIEKNINIRLHINKNFPNVYFDKDALDSIFCNLVSNAIKYSMPHSTIRITNFVDKGKIIFSVKDEGLGMNKDDLKKVFGEFAKLSARPTGNEPSSGLGLSIVKKLVEQMGGEVYAYSEGINKGSTFSFSLRTTAIVKTMTA